MPPLIKFMIRHFFLGFVLGLTVVAVIVWNDVLSMGDLFSGPDTWGALALFCMLMGLTFGSVQMAVAVMTAEDPNAKPIRVPGPEEERRRAEIEARRKLRRPPEE